MPEVADLAKNERQNSSETSGMLAGRENIAMFTINLFQDRSAKLISINALG
jgi:hypothetical protein